MKSVSFNKLNNEIEVAYELNENRRYALYQNPNHSKPTDAEFKDSLVQIVNTLNSFLEAYGRDFQLSENEDIAQIVDGKGRFDQWLPYLGDQLSAQGMSIPALKLVGDPTYTRKVPDVIN